MKINVVLYQRALLSRWTWISRISSFTLMNRDILCCSSAKDKHHFPTMFPEVFD